MAFIQPFGSTSTLEVTFNFDPSSAHLLSSKFSLLKKQFRYKEFLHNLLLKRMYSLLTMLFIFTVNKNAGSENVVSSNSFHKSVFSFLGQMKIHQIKEDLFQTRIFPFVQMLSLLLYPTRHEQFESVCEVVAIVKTEPIPANITCCAGSAK